MNRKWNSSNWTTVLILTTVGFLLSNTVCSQAQDTDRDKSIVLKLKNPDSAVQIEAANSLWALFAKYGAVGADPKVVLPAAIAALKDEDSGVRTASAKAWAQLGTPSGIAGH